VDVPGRPAGRYGTKKTTMSAELLRAARLMPGVAINFATLDVKTTKSRIKPAEVRGIITKALCEAYTQTPPDEEKLAAATKKHRAVAVRQRKKQAAANRKSIDAYKKRQEAAKQKAAAKLELKVAAAIGGKVGDLDSLIKALEARTDKAKIAKATAMLKAEKFQLFNDIAADHMAGVVQEPERPGSGLRVPHHGRRPLRLLHAKPQRLRRVARIGLQAPARADHRPGEGGGSSTPPRSTSGSRRPPRRSRSWTRRRWAKSLCATKAPKPARSTGVRPRRCRRIITRCSS
jgi:plasmid stability protein